MSWYAGFYKRIEGDNDQPKYKLIYIDNNDIATTKCFDDNFNLTAEYTTRDYMSKHHCVSSSLTGSESKLILSNNKRLTKRKGYGSKFGKQTMKYNSLHEYTKNENQITYKNNYKFENGDISKAVYIRESDQCPFIS